MLNPLERAAFDLSARVKLRVTGQDRHRYLNGQITNDAGKATATEAIAACVLNVKGKMDAHVLVRREGDAFLIDADEALRDTLQPRLERYVIADDVAIEDVTDELSIFHVIGDVANDLATVAANRFGLAGSDIWVARAAADQIRDRLGKQAPLWEAASEEIFRIEQGIPRWGRELTPDILPPEANLEESCIDYGKGCYIGQEVISRMKMSGQTNKRLCGLVGYDGSLAPGMRLLDNEKDVGWITSATNSARIGANIALGFVKRGANSTGTQLRARSESGTETRALIVDLPFKPAAG